MNRKETYAKVVQRRQQYSNSRIDKSSMEKTKWSHQNKPQPRNLVVCWSCQKQGHISRNCPNKSVQTKCHACQEHGHIRRECPNINCSHCKKNGHFSFQCWQKREENYMKQRYYHGMKADGSRKSIAALDENRNEIEDFDDEHEERDQTPNSQAPSRREVMGAIC